MRLKLAHLYPDLLNLYADRGNIRVLQKRAEWRGILLEAAQYNLDDDIDFSDIDIVFIGGGSDREQALVAKRLLQLQSDISHYAEHYGVIVAVCGGYQLLGHYYKLENEYLQGLSLLDIYTEQRKGRLIGNVVAMPNIKSSDDSKPLPVVGFENHGGRTFIGSHTPFAKLLHGKGNNGKDGGEGVLYKNIIGTYLHGPLFPKNPHIADYIIEQAVRRHYEDYNISPLHDETELEANKFMYDRYIK